MSFSANSEECICVTPDGTFTRFSLRAGKAMPPISSLESIDTASVESISIAPKLDYAFFGFRNGELRVIRTRDGKRVVAENVEPENADTAAPTNKLDSDSARNGKSAIVASQLNAKNNRIALIHADGSIGTLEFPSLQPMENLPQTFSEITDTVGRSLNGKYLAGIDRNRRVSVYDLDIGELLCSWRLVESETPRSIAVENSGKRIAIGLETGSVLVFQGDKD